LIEALIRRLWRLGSNWAVPACVAVIQELKQLAVLNHFQSDPLRDYTFGSGWYTAKLIAFRTYKRKRKIRLIFRNGAFDKMLNVLPCPGFFHTSRGESLKYQSSN
jgi:hypothetical protein